MTFIGLFCCNTACLPKIHKESEKKSSLLKKSWAEGKRSAALPTLKCQPTEENELCLGSTRHTHTSAPQRYQKGTNARVNQRGQSMRSILSLQILGPYCHILVTLQMPKKTVLLPGDVSNVWEMEQLQGDYIWGCGG